MYFVSSIPRDQSSFQIDVVHGDRRITWNLKLYQRILNISIEEVFKPINDFLEKLPKEKQDEIFGIYTSIRSILDDVIDPGELHNALTKECKKLYDILLFKDVKHYTSIYGSISVPPTIKDSYDQLEISERDQTNNTYQERTYLKETYLDLVYLGVYLKPMIPIWSEYAQILDQTNSKTNYREYEAMSILNTSSVMDTAPLQFFRRYVELSMPTLDVSASSILGGLGSSEIADWLVSQAFVRKLVAIPLSTTDDKTSVISVLFSQIRYASKGAKRKFIGNVTKLRKPKGDEDDEAKSVLDAYKIKEQISVGDLMALSVFAEDYIGMAKHIDPTIPKEMIKICHRKLQSDYHRNRIPTSAQKIILRWIMTPALSPKSLDNLHRVAMLNCYAVAQATLWHWGFNELALILTGEETRDDQGMLLGGTDVNSRITKTHADEIMIYYPHWQVKHGKEHNRRSNPACRSIDHTSDLITHSDWRVDGPEELMVISEYTDNRGIFCTPPHVKAWLSLLVIHIAKAEEQNSKI